MSEIVTLEVPERLALNAREVARQSRRSLEAVLLEWLDRAASDLPMEALSDQEVLDLRDNELDPEQQTRLTHLLTRQREGLITGAERADLDALMETYRRQLVLKSRALRIAVERGLQPPLSEVAQPS